MLKSHVICLTCQLSIHSSIILVSPWRRWGMGWIPFQGKHYSPRGNGRSRGHPSLRANPDILPCTCICSHIYHPLYQTGVLQFYSCLKSNTGKRRPHGGSGYWGWDWNHKFLLFLTILNSQLWVMKTSPAEQRKSFLHGFVLSCKDAIRKPAQTKSCHAPGGQWSMTIESSWKHLRI